MKYSVGLSGAGVRKKSPITLLLLGSLLVVIISVIIIWYEEKNLQTIEYKELSGPIPNPLMGLAPWATMSETEQPFTLVYVDLTWREIEPREGVYDFDTFENQQQLARWREERKRVVFRFVADVPGNDTHLDIPDWLYEKINGSGVYYDNEYGKGFSPDYSNPIFVEYHNRIIKALGDKYGKDGFFAYIELGSLGHWGEWHTHPGSTPLPSEDIRNLFVLQYVEAFPGTHLLMRRPFSIAQKLDLGLYNDMTADFTETSTWLDWIENGGEYLPQEVHGLSPMPNGWQKAPIGGEQAPPLSDEEVYEVNLGQTLQLIKESHTTFIGPEGPYNVERGGSLQNGINQILAVIGYRIYLDYVLMPRWVNFGSDIQIKITFSNSGIAPIYYNWPTKAYVFNNKGNPVVSQNIDLDLRKILPGELYNVSFDLPIGDLENAKYTIGIAIIDPIDGQPALKLANVNNRPDLIQEIGSFEINWYLSNHLGLTQLKDSD